ncbi:SDR family NAD(P)-dependent oxidoreductase [Methylocella sp.]|uniref:SDR family NAD(P)-dependent oxidoreductase n=1 Tax=Methylocella sp. TaxID=1978226 RepID=UPI0037831105
MTQDQAKTAVIFGVGPSSGLGAALARRFAREGLKVTLAARSGERLAAVAAEIAARGGTARARVADATREQDVEALFSEAAADGALDLVVFNAGANYARPALELEPEAFEALWRVNAYGGFLVGREAARRLSAQGRGTLIFTGATASLRARPPFLGFAAAKSALRAVAQGLAREFGPKGVHVAHVIVDGVINGDFARERFPQFVAAKGEDGLLKPDDVADAYVALWRQKRSAWSHEIDLRPFAEPF